MFSKSYSISFIYPNSVTLKNGNIFVIHKEGVTICNSDFSEIIKNVITFIDEKKIDTEDKLSRVSIAQFDDGYIISVIINKIYCFNIRGEYIKDFDFDPLPPENIYYALSTHKIQNNWYYFLFGYINQNQLYLYYIKHNGNSIFVVAFNSGLSDRSGTILNKGLVFQFTSVDQTIICMYYLRIGSVDYLSVAFLNIQGATINFKDQNINFEKSDIQCFKSVISIDRSKVFFCFYNSVGETSCWIYDMNKKMEYNGYGYDKHCLTKYYALNLKYFPEKNQYVFSCLTEGGGIQFYIFNQTFQYPISYKYDEYKFTDFASIYGHSILYYNYKECYYLLSDLENNNIYYPFKPLLDFVDETSEKEEDSENVEDSNATEDIINKNDDNSDGNIDNNNGNDDNSDGNVDNNNGNDDNNDDNNNDDNNNGNDDNNNINDDNNNSNNDDNNNNNNDDNNLKEEDGTIKCKEKCESCNKESISNNLCISCNTQKGYFPLNIGNYLYSKSNNGFVECVNSETKPSNFYFNKENNNYYPCYDTCATCEYGGDAYENNCTSCEINYILKPDFIGSTNCVTSCLFNYYYSNYGQYRCTASPQCPEGYNFYIPEKGKCIDSCENDDTYQYQYNGLCLKECPLSTNSQFGEYLCKDMNLLNCLLTQMEYKSINESVTDDNIELIAKNYAREFKYTEKHVSVYNNSIYNIFLYKDCDCISQLSLNVPEIDFGECVSNLKESYQIKENLVVAVITKMVDGVNYPIMKSFSIFDPNSGEKLPYEDVCQNDSFIVKENLFMKFNISKNDLNSLIYLTQQNIDIFNLSSAFYTDICYDFNSPIEGKDIPLKDRIALYFPNITLCENGCETIGVNLTSLKSMCNCNYNEFINNNVFSAHHFYQKEIMQLENIISDTNIEVAKCYKYFLSMKYFLSSPGCFIIIGLMIILIIITIIFFCKSLFQVRKYILNMTQKFLSYTTYQRNKSYINSLQLNGKNFNAPPKKNKSLETNIINGIKKTKRKSKMDKRKTVITIKPKRSSISINNYKSKSIISINELKSSFNNENSPEKKIIINNRKSIMRYNSKKLTNNKRLLHTGSKGNIEEFLVNSNDIINSNKQSTPSFQPSLENNLNTNLKDGSKINMDEYLSTEYEDMDYDDAINRDKRSFCIYYYDRLKISQLILSTLYAKDPLIPRPIKILLLIIDIDLYLFVNGLFFSENYISEILHINKEENMFDFLERFMDRFLYITTVGVIINYMIEFFFIEEKKIKGIFKREKNNFVILKYKITIIIKTISLRYKLFIFVSFFIISFTFYYVICFNSVYPSMKEEWIKTSIIVIIAMQLLSTLEILLEACIRFISFKCKNEKIYKLSLLLN